MTKVCMDDAIERMSETMDLRKFAASTKKTYLGHLQRFADFSSKHPAACSYEDVRKFLLHAINVKKFSSEYVNSAYGAIKFFYESSLCREWNMKHIPRVKNSTSCL